MKIDNLFIYQTICHNDLLTKENYPNISDDDLTDYQQSVEAVDSRIKQQNNLDHVIHNDSITPFILTGNITTFVELSSSSTHWYFNCIRSVIHQSLYSNRQKDIYLGILIYFNSRRIPNTFDKIDYEPTSFVKYVIDHKNKSSNHQPTRSLDVLLNGMFDYPPTEEIDYNSQTLADILAHLKTLKLTDAQKYCHGKGYYISTEGLQYYQNWDVFHKVVKYQIRYLLFGSEEYFDNLNRYFDANDIAKVDNVQVSDRFINDWLLDVCDRKLDLVRSLATNDINDKISKKMIAYLFDKKNKLLDEVAKIDAMIMKL